MCIEVSSVSSFFTDAEFCFLGADLRRFSCWCPISTCGVDAYGNPTCHFTTFTIFLCIVGIVLGAAGVLTYLHAASEYHDLHMKEVQQAGTHRYRDVLFGVYHVSNDDHLGATDGDNERKPLVPLSATVPTTNGGTFSSNA